MGENLNDPVTPGEDVGNTVDGTRSGDGDENSLARVAGAGGSGDGGQDVHAEDREEQKQVYETPEGGRDHAVGGSEGTADGM